MKNPPIFWLLSSLICIFFHRCDLKELVWISSWHLSDVILISLSINYFRILKCFCGEEGDLLIGRFVRFRKAEVKAETSRLNLPKLNGWRSLCIISGGKEKRLWVSAALLTEHSLNLYCICCWMKTEGTLISRKEVSCYHKITVR